MKRVSQKSISENLGLSQSTVSLVMQNPYTHRVAEKTRKRILEHVQQLQGDGQQIPSRLAGNLCFLAPRYLSDTQNYEFYYGSMLHGAEEGAAHLERGLVFKSWEREADIARVFDTGPIAGVVHLNYLPDSMIRNFQEQCPVVLINVQPDTPLCDVVSVDHRGAVRRMMKYLHGLGHRRIAYAQDPPREVLPEHRLTHYHLHFGAYMESLNLFNLPVRMEYVLTCGEGTDEANLKKLLDLPEPPTAIAVFNDYLAMRLMGAAQNLGLDLPRDLSFAGFDDVEASALLQPALTTIRQERKRVGRVAVEVLGERLRMGRWDNPRITLCGTEIVERESVWDRNPIY